MWSRNFFLIATFATDSFPVVSQKKKTTCKVGGDVRVGAGDEWAFEFWRNKATEDFH